MAPQEMGANRERTWRVARPQNKLTQETEFGNPSALTHLEFLTMSHFVNGSLVGFQLKLVSGRNLAPRR